jgi:hypothetical protein
VSWTELYPSGPGTPPALPLRDTPAIGYCADCLRDGPCPDRAQEITLAGQHEPTGGLT